MTHRIAIASSDGRYIDLHFGRAQQFYIYDVDRSDYHFVEIRKSRMILKHDANEFDSVAESIKDCLAVFVSRIGKVALFYIMANGLRVFEAPYPIEGVLEKLIREGILDKVYKQD